MQKNQEYIAFLNPIAGYDKPHFSFTSLTFPMFPRKEKLRPFIFGEHKGGGINREITQGYDMIYFKNPHGDDYYQNYVQYFQEVHAEVMKKYR